MVEVVKKSALEIADDVVVLSALPPLMAKLAESVHETGEAGRESAPNWRRIVLYLGCRCPKDILRDSR